MPLSGGLDSRLVAGMLKRMGIETAAVCYTYGDESSEEVQLSRQVAEALAIPGDVFVIRQRYSRDSTLRSHFEVIGNMLAKACRAQTLTTSPQSFNWRTRGFTALKRSSFPVTRRT